MSDIRHVQASFDAESGVWWAESADLPGLVSEAPTLEALIDRVTAVAGDLLIANGESPHGVNLQFVATRPVQAA